eukprot:NODE_13_length_2980_cov_470.272262_g10_i0.p1 GENE.NODE_13_length_2980_cov_470.272262_g10_i0~~NODE_13_length_2980_cov_470.272262_g10_i0.p1  ORF type:complete len:967 (+),score=140.17 NODE_13_length_2980_cov_470.272262_g10_i0:32-2902(+)
MGFDLCHVRVGPGDMCTLRQCEYCNNFVCSLAVSELDQCEVCTGMQVEGGTGFRVVKVFTTPEEAWQCLLSSGEGTTLMLDGLLLWKVGRDPFQPVFINAGFSVATLLAMKEVLHIEIESAVENCLRWILKFSVHAHLSGSKTTAYDPAALARYCVFVESVSSDETALEIKSYMTELVGVVRAALETDRSVFAEVVGTLRGRGRPPKEMVEQSQGDFNTMQSGDFLYRQALVLFKEAEQAMKSVRTGSPGCSEEKHCPDDVYTVHFHAEKNSDGVLLTKAQAFPRSKLVPCAEGVKAYPDLTQLFLYATRDLQHWHIECEPETFRERLRRDLLAVTKRRCGANWSVLADIWANPHFGGLLQVAYEVPDTTAIAYCPATRDVQVSRWLYYDSAVGWTYDQNSKTLSAEARREGKLNIEGVHYDFDAMIRIVEGTEKRQRLFKDESKAHVWLGPSTATNCDMCTGETWRCAICDRCGHCLSDHPCERGAGPDIRTEFGDWVRSVVPTPYTPGISADAAAGHLSHIDSQDAIGWAKNCCTSPTAEALTKIGMERRDARLLSRAMCQGITWYDAFFIAEEQFPPPKRWRGELQALAKLHKGRQTSDNIEPLNNDGFWRVPPLPSVERCMDLAEFFTYQCLHEEGQCPWGHRMYVATNRQIVCSSCRKQIHGEQRILCCKQCDWQQHDDGRCFKDKIELVYPSFLPPAHTKKEKDLVEKIVTSIVCCADKATLSLDWQKRILRSNNLYVSDDLGQFKRCRACTTSHAMKITECASCPLKEPQIVSATYNGSITHTDGSVTPLQASVSVGQCKWAWADTTIITQWQVSGKTLTTSGEEADYRIVNGHGPSAVWKWKGELRNKEDERCGEWVLTEELQLTDPPKVCMACSKKHVMTAVECNCDKLEVTEERERAIRFDAGLWWLLQAGLDVQLAEGPFCNMMKTRLEDLRKIRDQQQDGDDGQ